MSPYRPKKRLGQHFLTAEKIISRMVELINPQKGQTIVEIGPGRGALTVPLAASGANLWGIEFDRDLIGNLETSLAEYKNVILMNRDFLSFHPEEYELNQFTLAGNLPYNITSPVIDWCIRYRDRLTSACLMVQQEIAERLTASPRSRNWSPLSISCQLFFDVTYCFAVPPHAFRPAPEVNSAVVKLLPGKPPFMVDLVVFDKVVRAAFAQRRKLLINNLVPKIVPSLQQMEDILYDMFLPRSSRAEELSIEDFVQLTTRLQRAGFIE